MTSAQILGLMAGADGLARLAGSLLLSIAAAVALMLLLRRLADLLRVPRWQRCVGVAARRRSAWRWRALHAAPLALAVAAWAFALSRCASRTDSVRRPIPGSHAAVLELYGDAGALQDTDGLVAELRAAGCFLEIKTGSDAQARDMLPLTLYCPPPSGAHGRAGVGATLEHRLQSLLARHIPGASERLLPLRLDPDAKVHRLRMDRVAEPLVLDGACDQLFAARALPLLAHALDHSAIRVNYSLRESTAARLPGCGIIRYGAPSDRPRAQLLCAVLSDTVGLGGIRVAPEAEPGLPAMSLNLSWSANGGFLGFAWSVLDEFEAPGTVGDGFGKLFREPEQAVVAKRWLKEDVPSGWTVSRDTDFRVDWLERRRGPWSFVVAFEPPEGGESASRPQCLAVCEEAGGTWKIVRFEPMESLNAPTASARKK